MTSRASGYTVALLMALEQVGSVTITCLSEILLMDRTTLPRDLKPLERQGWVSITEGEGEDRRKRFIALTPDGRDLHKRALWVQAQIRIRDYMGDDRYKGLLGQLSDIVKLNRQD